MFVGTSILAASFYSATCAALAAFAGLVSLRRVYGRAAKTTIEVAGATVDCTANTILPSHRERCEKRICEKRIECFREHANVREVDFDRYKRPVRAMAV